MHKSKSPPLVTLLLAVLALFAFGAVSLHAEDVFVTAKKGATNGGTTETGCPPSCFTNLNSTWGTSARSTVNNPAPTIPASDRYADVSYILNTIWAVTPTDITVSYGGKNWTFQACQNTGLYKVYVTKGGAIGTSASPDVVVTVTVDANTTLYDLSDTGGTTPLASLTTTAFQQAQPNDAWVPVCFIRNTTPNPTVIFEDTAGTISGTSRWYCDAVRFQFIDPCADVTPQASVTGPLAAGQTYVNVDVAVGATNVTVYANAAPIGITNDAAGFAGGTLQVNTTALVKDQAITATQIKLNPQGNPCPSSPGTARPVGGGPNATLSFFGSVFKTPAATGPVGANGSALGFAYAMPCTYWSYGAPPVGGLTNIPSGCWQTISFLPTVDPAREYNSGSLGDFTADDFCSLAGLVINQVDPDSGPYDIYVDQIMNGNTVVEDFESYAVDSVSTFVAPSAAILPDPATTYLPPNSSTISTANAYDGTKSCRIKWQWTTAGGRFARVLTSGASGGKVYPQMDPSLPISFKILVLPVGTSVGTVFNGTVSAITNTTPVFQYGSLTMGVGVSGGTPPLPTYTYAWESYDSGTQTWNPLGVTTRTCTVDPLPNTATARYRVLVSDGGCSVTKEITLNLATPLPIILTQPVSAVVGVGSPANIWVEATNGPAGGDQIQYWTWEKVDVLTNLANVTQLCSGYPTDSNLNTCISSAQLTDTAYYRCIVNGSYGSVTSSWASLLVVPADVVLGSGTGLRGNYYNQPTFTGAANIPESWGSVDLSRVDPAVAFDWVLGSPDPAIQDEHFTARWYGQIQPLYSDTYEFTVRSDDGFRLWIDKQLVVGSWIPKGASDVTGTITLNTAKHDILLEYFEQGGNASVQLFWTNYGGNIAKTFVPQQQLFAGTSWTPPSIALTAPANVTLPATVGLSANVTTNDGIVKQVEFYNGATLLNTDVTPPYSYDWAAPVGAYSVTAKVVYNESSKETSSASSVTVNAPAQQSVTIDSIVNNGGGTVTINYSGGAGASFTLMKSSDPALARDSWTAVTPDQPATPGSFTITPAGNEFYLIRSN